MKRCTVYALIIVLIKTCTQMQQLTGMKISVSIWSFRDLVFLPRAPGACNSSCSGEWKTGHCNAKHEPELWELTCPPLPLTLSWESCTLSPGVLGFAGIPSERQGSPLLRRDGFGRGPWCLLAGVGRRPPLWAGQALVGDKQARP